MTTHQDLMDKKEWPAAPLGALIGCPVCGEFHALLKADLTKADIVVELGQYGMCKKCHEKVE